MAFKSDYFKDNWNLLDFFIVLTADVALLLEVMDTLNTIKSFFKAVRILRMLRLISLSQNLKDLMVRSYLILPSIMNVGSLILLIFFLFAIIGMNMFAGVIYQTELNENNNF